MCVCVTRLFSRSQQVYYGNGTQIVDNMASDLGGPLTLSVDFRNNGPSDIIAGYLDIFIPSSSAETGTNYYYYPASLVSSLCMSFIFVHM